MFDVAIGTTFFSKNWLRWLFRVGAIPIFFIAVARGVLRMLRAWSISDVRWMFGVC